MRGTDAFLWEAYRLEPSDANRNAILEFHLPWIEDEVRWYTRKCRAVYGDTLSSVAIHVLTNTIPKYDGRVPFVRHLFHQVHYAATAHTRDPNRRQREFAEKIDESRAQLSHQLGRRAIDAEVAESLGTTETAVAACLAETESLGKAFPEPSYHNQSFERLVDGLGDTERQLLTLYYVGGYTQKEIADRIGVSAQWVGYMLKKSRENVKNSLLK